jgi:dTDP-glucose 4,6-dehydratase
MVRAYAHTFGLPVTITNCTNNYGPYQFPEKLIPVVINNMLEGKPIPVYGDGANVRDWLYVVDHCSAVWTVMTDGAAGETYGVGGENEWKNIDLVCELCRIMDDRRPRSDGSYEDLITFVTDRPGHDRRYAIDCAKIKSELGWSQSVSFSEGLERTVDWYLAHGEWMDAVKSGESRGGYCQVWWMGIPSESDPKRPVLLRPARRL